MALSQCECTVYDILSMIKRKGEKEQQYQILYVFYAIPGEKNCCLRCDMRLLRFRNRFYAIKPDAARKRKRERKKELSTSFYVILIFVSNENDFLFMFKCVFDFDSFVSFFIFIEKSSFPFQETLQPKLQWQNLSMGLSTISLFTILQDFFCFFFRLEFVLEWFDTMYENHFISMESLAFILFYFFNILNYNCYVCTNCVEIKIKYIFESFGHFK